MPNPEVLDAVGSGLQALATDETYPPEIRQGFEQMLAQFVQMVEAAQGGGEMQGQEPSQPQPEAAGGNPNARPMGPQG